MELQSRILKKHIRVSKQLIVYPSSPLPPCFSFYLFLSVGRLTLIQNAGQLFNFFFSFFSFFSLSLSVSLISLRFYHFFFFFDFFLFVLSTDLIFCKLNNTPILNFLLAKLSSRRIIIIIIRKLLS